MQRDPLPGSFDPAKVKNRIRLHQWRSVALLLVTAIVLLYGVIYPNLSVAVSSFQRTGTWTLANYTEIHSQ